MFAKQTRRVSFGNEKCATHEKCRVAAGSVELALNEKDDLMKREERFAREVPRARGEAEKETFGFFCLL